MRSFFRHPNYYNFLPSSIRMSGKNIIFDDKKINKSNFYKNKKLFNIHDIKADKILVSKKSYMARKAHSNTSLDTTMMMMSLDLYV